MVWHKAAVAVLQLRGPQKKINSGRLMLPKWRAYPPVPVPLKGGKLWLSSILISMTILRKASTRTQFTHHMSMITYLVPVTTALIVDLGNE